MALDIEDGELMVLVGPAAQVTNAKY